MTPAQHNLFPSWREENERTNYPFSDAATLTNNLGLFIPPETFLDACIYPAGGRYGMRLSKVVVTADGARIYIGDSGLAERCSGFVSFADPPDDVILKDAANRDAGLLISDAARLAFFQAWPLGTHEFTSDQAEFIDRVCVPSPEYGVSGFLLDDGTLLSGDVWFVGADGIVLSADELATPAGCLGDETESADKQVIRVDVIGDPLFRRRLCEDLFESPRFLQTVTFVSGNIAVVAHPDDVGDIQIAIGTRETANPVLHLAATAEALELETIGELIRDF